MKKFVILSVVAMMAIAMPLMVIAQDSVTVLGGIFPWFQPVVEGLLGKYGWAAQAVMWVGVLRFAFKPVFELWHKVAETTVTKKDDAFLAKVENSKAMKIVLFVLDWLASLKLVKK
jgi:hypothetical protein